MRKILLFILLFIGITASAQVKIAGYITTLGPTDTYPTHIDSLGKGGFVPVTTITARNAIPSARRRINMWVYVAADSTTYSLKTGLTNSDWDAIFKKGVALGITSLTAAFGILGGTITSTGTISADTASSNGLVSKARLTASMGILSNYIFKGTNSVFVPFAINANPGISLNAGSGQLHLFGGGVGVDLTSSGINLDAGGSSGKINIGINSVLIRGSSGVNVFGNLNVTGGVNADSVKLNTATLDSISDGYKIAAIDTINGKIKALSGSVLSSLYMPLDGRVYSTPGNIIFAFDNGVNDAYARVSHTAVTLAYDNPFVSNSLTVNSSGTNILGGIATDSLKLILPLNTISTGYKNLGIDTLTGKVKVVNQDSIIASKYMLLTGRNFADSGRVKLEYNNGVNKNIYSKIDSDGIEMTYIGLSGNAMLTVNSNGVGITGGARTDSLHLDPFVTDHISQYTTEDPNDPDSYILGYKMLVLNTQPYSAKFGKIQYTTLDSTFMPLGGRQFNNPAYNIGFYYNNGGTSSGLTIASSGSGFSSGNGSVGSQFSSTPSGLALINADSTSIVGRKININSSDSTFIRGALGVYLKSDKIFLPIQPLAYSSGGNKLLVRNNTTGLVETVTAASLFPFSPAPTIVAGAGAGTSPTISIVGNNNDGVVTIITGTLPTLGATIATISFSGGLAYSGGSSCILFPNNSSAQLLSGATMVGTVGSTGSWVINAGTTALTAVTTYKFNYHVGGY